jgi:hypothetical protein
MQKKHFIPLIIVVLFFLEGAAYAQETLIEEYQRGFESGHEPGIQYEEGYEDGIKAKKEAGREIYQKVQNDFSALKKQLKKREKQSGAFEQGEKDGRVWSKAFYYAEGFMDGWRGEASTAEYYRGYRKTAISSDVYEDGYKEGTKALGRRDFRRYKKIKLNLKILRRRRRNLHPSSNREASIFVQGRIDGAKWAAIYYHHIGFMAGWNRGY